VLASAKCFEVHGCCVSVQNEQSAHPHVAHCVAACAGLHSGPHARYDVSAGDARAHASLGGGGGGGGWSKPSQNAQPRHPHNWQCDSRCEAEQTPDRQVRKGASCRMPESHGSLVDGAQALHCRHLHRAHEAFPLHETSQSSHFVSCGWPDEHARKPWQKPHEAHLHVSQCAALLLKLQCDKQAR
jgi:hypothetical protein